ncbi:MAG TPA: MFS transporter [Candidatus Bathyarchaeia archaeon]|nr:MFS transporter [Candidatus Bathyarchaeia archaeon]
MLGWIARDGRIVLVEKAVRTFPYGFLAVVFPVYLSQIGFDTVQIGIVLTLTVATSALYTFIAGIVGDRLGRRRVLVFFALTDAVAGLFLLSSTMWWAPVLAGIVGNMSVGAGEIGPYLSMEQAILPKTAELKRRTLTFSVYNLVGYASLSGGALLAGLPDYLGMGLSGYRPLFLGYLASGLFGMFLYSRLSRSVEQDPGVKRQILSKESRPIVYRLSGLFSVDAFAGGFIGQSILFYYFYTRYGLDLSSLGLLSAAAQLVTAGSFYFAARIASRIGLVNTMVFTHIPSNLLLLGIPFAPSAGLAVGLLLSRQSLSQMDVPTRQSYLMSMVPEADRTPTAGITNVSRTTAQTVSPSISGLAMASLWLGAPFIFAGSLKLVYDVALYKFFRQAKPPQETRQDRIQPE